MPASAWGSSYLTVRDRQMLALTFGFGEDVEGFTTFLHEQQAKAGGAHPAPPPRPVLLDLFCGAGGAAKGYWLAGFDVIGVDIRHQGEYPYTFYRGDALELGREILDHAGELGIVAVHASPPCQHHTTLAKGTNSNRDDHLDLVAETRELLVGSGLPYIIENVPSAPLIDPVTLCGEMFGLDVIRHRIFESNIALTTPEHVEHRGHVAGFRHGEWVEGPYFPVHGKGGGKGSVREWQEALGIDWISIRRSLAESIPPAFTECLGEQLMSHVSDRPTARIGQ